MLGVDPLAGLVADGHVIYPGALGGATVIHRPTHAGLEDFVVFESRPALERLEYRVQLEGTTAGARLVANTLEFLDSEGTPRLRIAPPYVVDAHGRMTWVSLTVSGCEVDRSPVAPWGRPVVDPGSSSCIVAVDWSEQELSYPLLVDPNWGNTLNMTAPRYSHTSTALWSGNVLVAGGTTTGGTILASAELYNPTTNAWAATGPMANSRTAHAAIIYFDVIVSGGSGACGTWCTQAERYSQTSGTWSAAGSMWTGRAFHTFTSHLGTSPSVALVAGGINASGVLSSGEIFDQSINSWSGVSNAMSAPRFLHSATAVGPAATAVAILAGGTDLMTTPAVGTGSVDKYIPPPTNAFGAVASMNGRYAHTSTRVDTDRVLVTGGVYALTGNCTRLGQIYDVSANTWTTAATNPLSDTCFHTATQLTDTTLMITGGRSTPTGVPKNETALYTAAPAAPWVIEDDMASERNLHAATRIIVSSTTKVLVSGGVNAAGTVLNTAEVYTP